MNDNQREAEGVVDLCTKCGLPDKARAEWGGSWVSHEPAYGHAFQSGSPRRFIFEYEPARDEWSARETEHDEIVVARGFDDGFRVLAGWVLEHEAFARFGENEKWERVEYEGDTLLVYGPAERISGEREARSGDALEAALKALQAEEWVFYYDGTCSLCRAKMGFGHNEPCAYGDLLAVAAARTAVAASPNRERA